MKTKKQSIVYLLMTFLLFYSPTSVLNAHSGSNFQASSEIQINTDIQSGSDIPLRLNSNTRPAFGFSMAATKYESSIVVFIYDFDGEVEIFIEGTDIHNSFNVNGTDCGSLDISSLTKGRAYNLLVDFGGVEYIGTFVK